MEAEAAKYIGAGIACLGMGGAGIGLGTIFGNYLAGALRNPSAADGQFGRLIFGFEAVIIGGLGSLWGTLAGGVVLGVAQTLGAQISPGFQILAGHLVFFLVLAFRPRGLFPRMDG